MNLINEKDKMIKWAAANEKKINLITEMNQESETFWKIKSSEDGYIVPYDFKSISEFEIIFTGTLKRELEKEIQRIVSVAVLKGGQSQDMNPKKQENDNLPEYIYVF